MAVPQNTQCIIVTETTIGIDPPVGEWHAMLVRRWCFPDCGFLMAYGDYQASWFQSEPIPNRRERIRLSLWGGFDLGPCMDCFPLNFSICAFMKAWARTVRKGSTVAHCRILTSSASVLADSDPQNFTSYPSTQPKTHTTYPLHLLRAAVLC